MLIMTDIEDAAMDYTNDFGFVRMVDDLPKSEQKQATKMVQNLPWDIDVRLQEAFKAGAEWAADELGSFIDYGDESKNNDEDEDEDEQ